MADEAAQAARKTQLVRCPVAGGRGARRDGSALVAHCAACILMLYVQLVL